MYRRGDTSHPSYLELGSPTPTRPGCGVLEQVSGGEPLFDGGHDNGDAAENVDGAPRAEWGPVVVSPEPQRKGDSDSQGPCVPIPTSVKPRGYGRVSDRVTPRLHDSFVSNKKTKNKKKTQRSVENRNPFLLTPEHVTPPTTLIEQVPTLVKDRVRGDGRDSKHPSGSLEGFQ